MANLYEIDRAILNCVDPETGEVIEPELLDALLMERTEKIENVALWIKNLESDAVAYKAEEDAFKARREKAEKKAENLRVWLAQACDGQKFETGRCAVSFRKSESVEVSDINKVPVAFIRTKTTESPDKTAIKAAIKAGQTVDGCTLVQKYNAKIL